MRTIAKRLTWIALTLMLAAGSVHGAGGYVQTNLISDIPGMAQHTDPNLINPWGISFTTGSPFWISNQGAGAQGIGTTTLYGVPGSTGGLTSGPTALIVTIPNVGNAAASDANGPTGQVATGAPGITTLSTDFQLNGSKAAFIFANMDGSISAWNGGSASTIMATVSGASFTGLAIGNSGGAAFLYAADQNSPNVNIFNSSWHNTGTLAADPNLPAGYVAFNVQNLNGNLYVTYVNPNNPLATLGAGWTWKNRRRAATA
jgi:uncharacterized protein (TIGR03118 family)